MVRLDAPYGGEIMVRLCCVLLLGASECLAGEAYRTACVVKHVAPKQVVREVVVLKTLAVPHAYPFLYGAGLEVPSLGDQAALHAAQLEKIRFQVASDFQKVLATEKQQASLLALKCETAETSQPAPVQILSADGYQRCAGCHAPANAAQGGGVKFASFAELDVRRRGQAARMVLTGEMPKGFSLDDAQRNALAEEILQAGRSQTTK